MRSRFSLMAVAAALSVAALSCDDAVSPDAAGDGAPSFGVVAELPTVCSPTTFVNLLADQTIPVGTVEISNDDEHLYVAYRTSSDWAMGKTALVVGSSLADIPTSGGGSPIIGKFPHSQRHSPGTTEVIWEVDLDGLRGSTVVVAAFAEVGPEAEGAWSDGEEITSGRSWATYTTHEAVECITRTVGSTGATIVFKNLTLEVPEGALDEDVVLTVTPIPASEVEGPESATSGLLAPSTAVAEAGARDASNVVASSESGVLISDGIFFFEGTAYRLGPADQTFSEPVKITLGYDEAVIPEGVPESLLRVFIIDDAFIDAGPNPELVDEQANTVSAYTDHFSDAVAGGPTAAADLGIAMTVEPNPVAVDEDLVHTITVTNHGPHDATDVRVGLVVEGDVDIKSPSQEGCTDLFSDSPPQKALVDCPAGDLANGASATLTLVLVPNTGGETLTSTARIDALDGAEDPNTDNDTIVEETTVEVAGPVEEADLEVTMTVEPDPVVADGDLVHTVTVKNLGPNPVIDVTLSLLVEGDVLIKSPNQEGCTDLTSSDPAGKLLIDCPVLDLSYMDSDELTLVFVPQTVPQELSSTATIEDFSLATDPDLSNNSVTKTTDVIAGADLEVVSFNLTPNPVLAGDPLTHSFEVRNNGRADVSSVSVAVRSVGDLSFPASHPDCGTKVQTADGKGFNCTILSLPAGSSEMLSVDLIPETASQTIDGTVRIALWTGPDDPDRTNNVRTASADVVASSYTGQIVFASERDGTTDVYVKDLGSGVVTQITDDELDEGAVAWSPDGTKIAFRRESATFLNSFDIWMMNADGSGLTQLTTTGDAGIPHWSPDGSEIVYNDSNDGDWEIYVLEVTNPSNIRQLTDNTQQDLGPDWSPDGTTIVYRRAVDFGDDMLRTMSAVDGSGDTALPTVTGEPRTPVWSPDGTKVAYTRQVAQTGERIIEVVDVGTGTIITVEDDGTANSSPAWSPDGANLIFAKNGLDPDLFNDIYDLWIVPADGSGSSVQVEASAADDVGPDWK